MSQQASTRGKVIHPVSPGKNLTLCGRSGPKLQGDKMVFVGSDVLITCLACISRMSGLTGNNYSASFWGRKGVVLSDAVK